MRVLASIVLFIIALAGPAGADEVYVNPYVRQDGVRVEGHYRTAPDGNPFNNWSYKGNINPHTGRIGQESYDSVNPGGIFRPSRNNNYGYR